MQTQDSQEVIARFFEALGEIINRGMIRGRQTFTRKYGINRWNLYTLEKNPASDIFQVAWLTYLSRDFGISCQWMLTGEGEMFAKPKKTK